jgi:hypothetical protein
VSVDQTPPTEPRLKPMTLTLAAVGALTAGLLAVAFSYLPPAAQPWNLSVIGALGLFAAARLGFWPAFAFVALAIGFKDTAVYFLRGMEPYPLSYLYFAGYAAIGWAFLRRTESPVRIGATALGTSVLFFLVSNFGSWLEQAYPYGYSFAGLLDCYAAGIPFYRGTFAGDLAFSAALFGAHAVLARAYFPAERVAVVKSTHPTEGSW